MIHLSILQIYLTFWCATSSYNDAVSESLVRSEGCSDGDVRIRNWTPYLYLNEAWSPICSYQFTSNVHSANAFCQKLGCESGEVSASGTPYNEDAICVGRCDEGQGILECDGAYAVGGCGCEQGSLVALSISCSCDGEIDTISSSCAASRTSSDHIASDFITWLSADIAAMSFEVDGSLRAISDRQFASELQIVGNLQFNEQDGFSPNNDGFVLFPSVASPGTWSIYVKFKTLADRTFLMGSHPSSFGKYQTFVGFGDVDMIKGLVPDVNPGEFFMATQHNGNTMSIHSRDSTFNDGQWHWAEIYGGPFRYSLRFDTGDLFETRFDEEDVGWMGIEEPLSVGRGWGGYFDGHFKDVLVYGREILPEERHPIERYLNSGTRAPTQSVPTVAPTSTAEYEVCQRHCEERYEQSVCQGIQTACFCVGLWEDGEGQTYGGCAFVGSIQGCLSQCTGIPEGTVFFLGTNSDPKELRKDACQYGCHLRNAIHLEDGVPYIDDGHNWFYSEFGDWWQNGYEGRRTYPGYVGAGTTTHACEAIGTFIGGSEGASDSLIKMPGNLTKVFELPEHGDSCLVEIEVIMVYERG